MEQASWQRQLDWYEESEIGSVCPIHNEEQNQSSASPTIQKEGTNVTSLKVLLVDDHEDFRRLLSSFLKSQHDIEVVGEAVNGDDAIGQSRQLHPDLVLMDLEMPKRDGFEATREIKRLLPSTRVVVLSVYSSEVYRRAAREYSADGFIDKNSMKDALRALLMDEQARRAAAAVNAA